MDELLMREAAPWGDEIWQQINGVVESVARQQLVGRRFIHLTGPLGAGFLAAPLNPPVLDGEITPSPVTQLIPFQTLQQPFRLSWEQLNISRQHGLALNTGVVAAATQRLVLQEEQLIFDTLKATAAGPAGTEDWGASPGGFQAVVNGLQRLQSVGVFGPYALVLSLDLYTALQRVMTGSFQLEITHIRELLDGNVFFAPALQDREALLVANAPYNLDLVIAQDMVTAYAGNEGLDQLFVLVEKLALRIRRPEAIVRLA